MPNAATAEGAEVQTRDRIVDAASLHVRLTAVQNAFKQLAKHAGKLAEHAYVHQASAVRTLRAGAQTMLFESVSEAMLEATARLAGDLEAAVDAALNYYDPAEHEAK